MFKRIDHVEIISRDFEKAVEFYSKVLGFELKEREKIGSPPLVQIAFLKLGDTMLEIIDVEGPALPSSHAWQIGYRAMAIEVDDMDRTVDFLKTMNVPVTWGPVDLGKSNRAEIKDPDGLVIELRQW